MNFPYYQIAIASFDSIFVIFICLRFLRQYRQTKKESIRDLFLFFFFYSIYFVFAITSPFIFINNPNLGWKIGHNVLATFFLFVGIGFLFRLPLSTYFPEIKIKNIIPILTAIYGAFVAMSNYFSKTMPVFEKGVALQNMAPWITYSNATFCLLAGGFIALFFLNGAMGSDNKYIRRRSILFAIGSLLVGSSGLYYIPNTFLITITLLFCLIGLILISIAISYKPRSALD